MHLPFTIFKGVKDLSSVTVNISMLSSCHAVKTSQPHKVLVFKKNNLSSQRKKKKKTKVTFSTSCVCRRAPTSSVMGSQNKTTYRNWEPCSNTSGQLGTDLLTTILGRLTLNHVHTDAVWRGKLQQQWRRHERYRPHKHTHTNTNTRTQTHAHTQTRSPGHVLWLLVKPAAVSTGQCTTSL